MMNELFVGAIADLARKGCHVTTQPFPGDPRRVLVSHGMGFRIEDVPEPVRGHTAHSLDAVIGAVAKWGKDAGVVWHDSTKIVVVLNDEDRLDAVTLPLAKSEQFESLCKIRSKTDFEQKQLIWFLRHELAGCVDADVIASIRVLDFKRSNDGRAVVEHGREALGKSVEAHVQSASKIPEEFDALVQVYDTPGVEDAVPVRLSLDIDAGRGMFRLAPQPGSLHRAINVVQDRLHGRLVEALKTVPVFYGSP